jgi:hypothetical protein
MEKIRVYHMTSMLWFELAKLTTGKVKHYQSDLYHDALWLYENIAHHKDTLQDEDTFYYGLRESGTLIGCDKNIMLRHSTIVYRIDIVDKGEHVIITSV